jgi:ElaA protein
MNIVWQICAFRELSAPQLYALLAAREAVFIVEQNCAYQDIDGLDLAATHLIGWSGDTVAAYLRILAPGARFAEASIGRVLTTPAFRNTGLGRELMQRSLHVCAELCPGQAIRISAQAHLNHFYTSLGFAVSSSAYLEDGIPHVEMARDG